MTVKDLIEELKCMPPLADVKVTNIQFLPVDVLYIAEKAVCGMATSSVVLEIELITVIAPA